MIKFNDFNLESHPGVKLITHLKTVGSISKELVQSTIIENKDLFADVVYLNGIAHDFGKSTKFFQKWLNEGKRTEKAHHSYISALFGYHLVSLFLKSRNLLNEFWYIPTISWVVILKHHGNLANIRSGSFNLISKINDADLEVLLEQINDIKGCQEVKKMYTELLKNLDFSFQIEDFYSRFGDIQIINDDLKRKLKDLTRKKSVQIYSIILFFYSILLDADKLDASGFKRIPERWQGKLQENIITEYKNKKFTDKKSKINQIREQAYNEVISQVSKLHLKSKIFSITLPTGAGKTLTGLSFALNLRERIRNEFGFIPRIIYSLPFLSIIDQNSAVIAEVLSQFSNLDLEPLLEHEKKINTAIPQKRIPTNLFMKQHHLADIEYIESRGDGNELYTVEELNIALLLTESWYSEIVITTFIQLFHSLITNKNRSARKFHNIVNSIIILDEVQSIPIKYWELIRETLKHLTEEYNCWIINMTATQPFIFEEKSIKELSIKTKEYFNFFDRVEYSFNLNKRSLQDFETELITEIITSNKDIIVVLNTISLCKELYTDLKDSLAKKLGQKPIIDNDGICLFSQLELINLSTHILPETRLKRIQRIKENERQKIIITTQLIEAGVDINVDIIYRDFAPLDSIIQTAGRCNRENSEEKGIVNVIQLIDSKTDRFYHSYIYDSTLIEITKEVIEELGNRCSEREFNLKAISLYFEKSKERKAQLVKTLEDIKLLNFSNISEFKLIEEKKNSVTIFVEINEKAKMIREKTQHVLFQKRGFEKKLELLKLKSDLHSYFLTVNCNKKQLDAIECLPKISDESTIRYIPNDILDEWYHLDIGFNFPEKSFESRII